MFKWAVLSIICYFCASTCLLFEIQPLFITSVPEMYVKNGNGIIDKCVRHSAVSYD
jgi:hypothetical protein